MLELQRSDHSSTLRRTTYGLDVKLGGGPSTLRKGSDGASGPAQPGPACSMDRFHVPSQQNRTPALLGTELQKSGDFAKKQSYISMKEPLINGSGAAKPAEDSTVARNRLAEEETGHIGETVSSREELLFRGMASRQKVLDRSEPSELASYRYDTKI